MQARPILRDPGRIGAPASSMSRSTGRLPASSSPRAVEPAVELVAGRQRLRGLRTVAFEERLSPGSGKAIQSRWDVVASRRPGVPDRGGLAARVVGRSALGPRARRTLGRVRADAPRSPEASWTKAVANPSSSDRRPSTAGKWIVSFLDRAALPTSFTLWIDKSSFRTLELQMTIVAISCASDILLRRG